MSTKIYTSCYASFLSIRGNLNYLNLARYGHYCEAMHHALVDTSFEKNNPGIKQLYHLGKIAA